MYKCAPLPLLHAGVKLVSPVFDREGRLLLGSDIEVTQDFLVQLHKRGVCNVVVEEQDWLRLSAFESKGKCNKALPDHSLHISAQRSAATDALDDTIGESYAGEIVASENPFSEQVQLQGTSRYDQDNMDRLFDHHQQAVHQVEDLLGQLAEGQSVAAEALQKISRDMVLQAAEDMDLFVCMGINPLDDKSLVAHSANVATFAIGLGATLGLDEQSLCDLGAGCLVHDAGMKYVDEKVYMAPHALNPIEFLDITRHPIIAADLLYERMQWIPVAVRMIVYQLHERCDGSGYPRGWKADQIHPLAKIAAVADAYVALVSPRPHRRALLPYFAIKKMLENVHAGLYDATVVRGLLHTVSLFPIGSFCQLSDDRLAKVIRTNGPAYDRPIVEAWHWPELAAEPKVIDLTKEQITIVKPLTSLH
jgi:HD-GYP domain-containing protein (c-di-GMP phosphodiesterase class II)